MRHFRVFLNPIISVCVKIFIVLLERPCRFIHLLHFPHDDIILARFLIESGFGRVHFMLTRRSLVLCADAFASRGKYVAIDVITMYENNVSPLRTKQNRGIMKKIDSRSM